ncbi:bifunctional protein-serine/threonine kinase/phosphatase [Methylogaea oryzae]|uniref:bifunctional protein-serine/threonine kinase/phosphatase n=1 Tax=Methylogaea oryzae TaxID=1295382 RepID=UPI001FEA19AB|nr:bifunctional protein-serine/threonine kinase/phosphatase [Methylogaea oryzae]
MSEPKLSVLAGLYTATGRRERNEDYAGYAETDSRETALRGLAFALADGVGGMKGGRVAAETCVRAFLDGYYSLPETLGVEALAARLLSSSNAWIHAVGRRDPALAGMSCTFSALILRGRSAHVAHVGDSRVYRLRGERLERLTQDHTLQGPDVSHILYRAVGIEQDLRADYAAHLLEAHDRFLLCSDGVHGALRETDIRRLLARRASPAASAEALVEQALAQGSNDNATALVVDVLAVPPADRSLLSGHIRRLPILPLPKAGQSVDGFDLHGVLSDGRYSRLFLAEDRLTGQTVALKFPHPRVASEREYREAFLREAWIGARVKSPWVAEVLEQPPGRQTRLYSVLAYYRGETLERRLQRRFGLDAGVAVALTLCKAVHALHRQRIVHRDIKPDNVLVTEDGGLKLLDLGVARLPAWDEDTAAPIPGTPSYMAPELWQGERGSVASDVFALGVTLYRTFSGGAYPYGEIEPFTTPRFHRPRPLSNHRPDLPAWLDAALARAVAVNPKERYADAMELAYDLENGATNGAPTPLRRRSLYERNPLRFWQVLSLALLGALLACLANH